MKIGIVTTWFERGAAYVSKQFEEVLAKEHDVFIYARGGEKYAVGDRNWDRENVTWGTKLRTPFQGTLIHKKEFSNWIKSNEIEVVIFNEQRWWIPLLWCNDLGVKTIAYIDYYTEETISLYASYDMLICNTKKHFKAFDWHKGARYVPWGTDVSLFAPKPFSSIDESKKITFFHSCGMSPERKGTDLLLKSLEFLDDVDFRLIVHTQVKIENRYPELSECISKFVSQGKLEIIEKTIAAPGLYKLGDIYVYPSRLEGIGLTIVEAISSGLGLIVPNCGPMNEFASPEFSELVELDRLYSRSDGYYWPQNEVSILKLAEAMRHFIEKNENINEIKLKARDYAIRNFDWEKNSIGLMALVNEIFKLEQNLDKQNAHDLIISYETKGLKKFNNIAISFSWLYQFFRNR